MDPAEKEHVLQKLMDMATKSWAVEAGKLPSCPISNNVFLDKEGLLPTVPDTLEEAVSFVEPFRILDLTRAKRKAATPAEESDASFIDNLTDEDEDKDKDSDDADDTNDEASNTQ